MDLTAAVADCLKTVLFLSGTFTFTVFSNSSSRNKVPRLWKESIVVPVAKVPSPKVLNDYGPVVVISLVMKGFQKIAKRSLLASVIDPLQFTY